MKSEQFQRIVVYFLWKQVNNAPGKGIIAFKSDEEEMNQCGPMLRSRTISKLAADLLAIGVIKVEVVICLRLTWQ